MEEKPKVSALLQREVVPFHGNDLQAIGASTLIENPDAVMRYMSNQGEKTFRLMQRDPAVGGPMRKRVKTLLAYGSKIVAADKSQDARDARDFCVAMMKQVPFWRTVQARMYDAPFWGWRPVERILRFDLDWKGKTWWGIHALREKNPWDFRFTTDREIAYVGGFFGATPKIYRGDDALKWVVCTSGSTNTPYGDPLFADVFLLYMIRQRWQQQYAQGMTRSVGSLEYTENSLGSDVLRETNAGGSQVKDLSEIAQELRRVVRHWNEDGFIINRSDGVLKIVAETKFVEGFDKGMRYLDEMLRFCILGETISGVQGKDGARAAAEVGERGVTDFAKSDAAEAEGWVSDGIFRPMIELNFAGFPVDRLPRWRSKINLQFSLDDAAKFVALGGKLDARAVAEEKNLPLFDESDPDAIPLERQAAPTLDPDAEDDDGDEKKPDPKKKPQKPAKPEPPKRRAPFRSLAEDAERQGEDVDAEVERALDTAAAAGSAHVRDVARRWLARNPDPKA